MAMVRLETTKGIPHYLDFAHIVSVYPKSDKVTLISVSSGDIYAAAGPIEGILGLVCNLPSRAESRLGSSLFVADRV